MMTASTFLAWLSSPRHRRRTVIALAALASISSASCLDDSPVAAGEPTVRATLNANVVGAVAGGTVGIRVGYRTSRQQFVVLRSSPERVEVAPATTVVLPLTVDIGPCLADSERFPSEQAGCALIIELTLSDAAGATIDSQTREATEPVMPGESVNFGTVTIGVTVSSVVVAPSSLGLIVGQELPLTATVRDVSGAVVTTVPVTWTTTDATTAQLLTATGASVTVRGLKLGAATVQASANGRLSNEVRVTVGPPPPLVISQRQGAGCVIVGQSINLDVQSPPGPITWSSGSPNVATVGASTGVVTGVAFGSAVMTATSGNRTGTANVCVTGPLRVTAPKSTIVAGETMALSATGASGGTLTYVSSSTGVATVDANGSVRGVGIGQTTVTATLRAASGTETSQIPVTVIPASVVVSPASASAAVTRTARFTAVARDLSGGAVSGGTATWTIVDPTVGQLLASTGNAVDVRALKIGSTTVRATIGGVAGTATFNATTAPVATALQKVSGDGAVCPTQSSGCTFVVRAIDATGLPVAGASIVWSSNTGCGAPRIVVTDDAGLASSTNICSFVPTGVYAQTATLQSNQQQALFSFTLRGLGITLQGYDSAGAAILSITSPAGVTATGLSARVDYRVGPATNYVTGLEFNRVTTPAALTVMFTELDIPIGSYAFDFTVSTTTPDVGPGLITIQFFWQGESSYRPNAHRPDLVSPTARRKP